MATKAKGRFAPSPSGRMHLGNIFSAVMAFASARSQNGSFIVRLEDIDERCKNQLNSQLLLEDLAWLGLSWDEDPIAQRERTAIYQDALKLLEQAAHVYPCFCSRADLHSASAPHASDGTPIYAGTCKALSPDQIAQKSVARDPALRIEVPCETIAFEDKRLGFVRQNLVQDCGDFILRRTDGAFAYQLVVVVDDALSGVTEVVRGADLVGSTPRQIWLNRLLGNPTPSYAHHPVLMAPDGRRLSKRDKSLDMGVMREQMTPQKMLGMVGYLAGVLDVLEPASIDDLVAEFNWKKVHCNDIVLESLSF